MRRMVINGESVDFGGGASSAGQVSYDPSESGLSAGNVQDAIDELTGGVSSLRDTVEETRKGLDDFKKEVEEGGGIGGGSGGNTIKITFEAAFKGQQYTVSDGDDTSTGTVPDSLVVSVKAVNCNSTYVIKARADNGVEYSTTVQTGAYYGQYTATLAVFTATINVTAAAGAEVKATLGGSSYTAMAADTGVAAVKVNQSGNYSITATKEGASSDSTSVNVTEETTYTAEVHFIVLTVKTPAGSKLTLKTGGEVFKEVESTTGTEVYYLPKAGTYTGEISKDGENADGSVDCSAYQAYTLELAFVHIYGVQWNGTNTTKWSRTDESAEFLDPVPFKAGATVGQYSSPFDNLQPWAGMTVESRTGGKMVAVPKFWYKLEKVGNGLKLQIADKATDGFVPSPAHMNRGDGKGERDMVYIGRYHCGSDFKSNSGQTPKLNTTRANFRTSIHALGTNIWQADFVMRFTIWLLYLVEFADWNSQKTIGKGCGDNSSAKAMGYTDSMPYHTGTTQSNRDTYGLGTQYRNIEGLWDNCYDFTDGCYNASNGLNIILNPNNFSDSSGGTTVGTPTSGWPSAFDVTNKAGFPMIIPSASNGGEDVASCDSWNFGASSPVVFVGGSYNQNGSHGLFYVYYTYATGASAHLGSRLQELP